jgi:hypothetical protein
MQTELRCPVCRDLMRPIPHDENETHCCLTCNFRAPRHTAELLAADRAELVRLRNGFAEGVTPLNRAVKNLAEDLRESARAVERAAALADDTFDVLARDGYRGRALAFRDAARRLEQLVVDEPPKAARHG